MTEYNGDDLLNSLPQLIVSSLWEEMMFGVTPSDIVEKLFSPVLKNYHDLDAFYKKNKKRISKKDFDRLKKNINAVLLQYDGITDKYGIKLAYHKEKELSALKQFIKKMGDSFDGLKLSIQSLYDETKEKFIVLGPTGLATYGKEDKPEVEPLVQIDPVYFIETEALKDDEWTGVCVTSEKIKDIYPQIDSLFDHLNINQENYWIMGFYLDRSRPGEVLPLEFVTGSKDKPVRFDEMNRGNLYEKIPEQCFWMVVFVSSDNGKLKNTYKRAKTSFFSDENETFAPDDNVICINYLFERNLRTRL